MADKGRPTLALSAAFADQLGFLRASASAYDAGTHSEARRLATSLYVLLHDDTRPNSPTRSILTQMGIKTQLWYISTAKPLHLAPSIALVCIRAGPDGVAFIPHCHLPEGFGEVVPWLRHLPFSSWWEESIFSNRGRVLSRKDLVLSVRNRDNGSHFDAELRDKGYPYSEFVTENDPGLVAGVDGSKAPIPDAHLASLRQIAWEFETSLARFKG